MKQLKVTQSLTQEIAAAAHLHLTEAETQKFTKDLQDILAAFTILDEIDVTKAKSSFQPIEQRNILREDIIKESLSQEEALRFTSNKERGFFIGPKTIG